MGKKTARYRRARDDRYGHPKTGGMKLQAYGLFDYAVAQNLLGVLQQSPRAIAARFGNAVAEIVEAIKILCTPRNNCAPIAVWWPALETLWIIEALDEQSDGGKADIAARKQLAALPTEVQAAIIERYGTRLSGNGPSNGVSGGNEDGVSGGLFPTGNREQVTGNSEQDLPLTPASGGTSKRKSAKATNESRIGEILDAIDRERARCVPPLPPLTETQRSSTTIAAAFGRGATVERLLECVGAWGRYVERDPSRASRLTPAKLFSGPNAQRGYDGGLAWCESLIDEERVLELRVKRVRSGRQSGPAEPSPRPESSGEVDLGEIGGAT